MDVKMDPKIKQQKLEMWTKKLEDLEKEYVQIMKRKGEAAQMGDLSENAAYQMAVEDAGMYRTRMSEVKKILLALDEGEESQ